MNTGKHRKIIEMMDLFKKSVKNLHTIMIKDPSIFVKILRNLLKYKELILQSLKTYRLEEKLPLFGNLVEQQKVGLAFRFVSQRETKPRHRKP